MKGKEDMENGSQVSTDELSSDEMSENILSEEGREEDIDEIDDALVDIEETAFLVREAINKTDVARDKDIVLVVGATGAGKSTLINYLSGLELYSYTGLDGVSARYDAIFSSYNRHKYAKVSDGNVSQTLYPQLFSPEGSSSYFKGSSYRQFHYCDTAGFEDNRTDETD